MSTGDIYYIYQKIQQWRLFLCSMVYKKKEKKRKIENPGVWTCSWQIFHYYFINSAMCSFRSSAPGPSPRLCHLVNWPAFEGYGFELIQLKGRVGHFIGAVHPHGPARVSGLRQGDHVIEINRCNVENETSDQVHTTCQCKQILCMSLQLY